MQRPVFANDYFYHIFNRGVDKRNIFFEDKDYRRFLFGMREFNDENSTINTLRRINMANEGNPMSLKPIEKDPLVKIVCYCLMPNHFHFILKQIKDKGISKFLQKLGIGYTKYFNQKNERSGVLFQGKFKAVLVDKDNYFNHLVRYIYLNPIDLVDLEWKERGLKNWRKTVAALKSYRWTNCNNYNQYIEFIKDYRAENFKPIAKLIID
jgi:putative transposase